MEREVITSPQNPKVKELLSLQEKPKTRREKGLYVVEGRREIGHCAAAGLQFRCAFVCPDILPDAEGAVPAGTRIFEVSRPVYEKIAYREGTEGIVAEVVIPDRTLEGLSLGENPLIVVLEGVEKPGNLGAVLRSADAAGADAVLVCGGGADLYNPNLVRASIGALFTRQVVATSSEEAIAWLKRKGVRIYTAQLQDSSLY